jgi:hypothetical protein
MMWGHNVNMAAGQVEFILYVKNFNLGDDLNSEVKLTCLLYKVSVIVKAFISGKCKDKYFCGSVPQWTGKSFLWSFVFNSLAVCCDTQNAEIFYRDA